MLKRIRNTATNVALGTIIVTCITTITVAVLVAGYIKDEKERT